MMLLTLHLLVCSSLSGALVRVLNHEVKQSEDQAWSGRIGQLVTERPYFGEIRQFGTNFFVPG